MLKVMLEVEKMCKKQENMSEDSMSEDDYSD